MVELIIERWMNRDGSTDHLWSLWAEGSRIDMGGPERDSASAETAGRAACVHRLGHQPDRVTTL